MKSNTFKEYIQPTVVLVLICLVMTFALAYVNSVTAPIIADNTVKAADAARAELLPAASSFEQYDGELVVLEPDKVYVTDCYIAKGVGMVVTVNTSSFGGILTVMFAGSVIIESVFEIPGMGLLSLEALESRDYPVFLGLLSVTSVLGLLGQILSDLCYVLIDPRIRFDR